MPVVEIIEHFPSAENYQVGEQYDITNPDALIAEGKVRLVDQEKETTVEPVASETPVTEGSTVEGADEAPVETPVEEVPAEVPAETPAPAEPTPGSEVPVVAPDESEAVVETPEETPTETETVE